MRKISVLLLAMMLAFPIFALADTLYVNEEMGLSLTVPDGWEVDKSGSYDTITHVSSGSKLRLQVVDTPDTRENLPSLTDDLITYMVKVTMLSTDVQALSHFKYTFGDTPIVGMTFTSSSFHVPMDGAAWFYPSASNTVAQAILLTPIDDPPDTSWFTDTMEEMFPALSGAAAAQYTNETLGLSLTVPDGWWVESNSADGADAILNRELKSYVALATFDTPNVKSFLSRMSQDEIIGLFPTEATSEDVQIHSYVDHVSADYQIVSMAFSFTNTPLPTNALIYLYPISDDTLVAIMSETPTDNPADMLWLTDAMAEKFPPLASDYINEYVNEEMRLSLVVPNGWEVEEYGMMDTITHNSFKGVVFLILFDTPDTKSSLPILIEEDLIEIVDFVMRGKDVQALSFFCHTSGNDPITGLTFTTSDFWPLPMNGIAWLYSSISNTTAMAVLLTAPDDPPDVAWFTDVLEEMFPALSGATTTSYINEAMGLSLAVPNGWLITHDESVGGGMIKHVAYDSRIPFFAMDAPGIKSRFAGLTLEYLEQVVAMGIESQTFQVLSYVNHASADNPVAVMTFTDMDSFSVPMEGAMYFYTRGDDTMAVIMLTAPIDDSPDVSWFTDVMEEMFPALSAAQATQYINEVMGLNLAVPDGWVITRDDNGGSDWIEHATQGSIMMLVTKDFPNVKRLFPFMDMESILLALPSRTSGEAFEILSFFNHTSSDIPIAGMAFTDAISFAVPMDGMMYVYPCEDDILAAIMLASPINDPPDISWFTDAMEEMFPVLSGGNITQYTNEAMRLSLGVPDGWAVEKDDSFDTITHISSKSKLMLLEFDLLGAKSLIPFLSKDELTPIVRRVMENESAEILSHFCNTFGDDPIVSMTFASPDSSVQMNGAAWFYPTTSDTFALAILLTPADDPPDAAWFTDALNTLFPASSSVHTTQYYNETMELSLTVPDGWVITYDEDDGNDMIRHAAGGIRGSKMILTGREMTDVKLVFPLIDPEDMLEAISVETGSDAFQLLSVVSHVSTEDPIICVSYMDIATFDVPMKGNAYFYSRGEDTLAAILLMTPIDDPPDVSWFTDVLEERFPVLSGTKTTQYTDEKLGLSLYVPDGWEIDVDDTGVLIEHATSNSALMLIGGELSMATLALALMSEEAVAELLPWEKDLQVLTYFNDAFSDHPLVGMTFTFTNYAMPMHGVLYLYAPSADTLAFAVLSTPVDNPPDVSWFTDEMAVMFPQLSATE